MPLALRAAPHEAPLSDPLAVSFHPGQAFAACRSGFSKYSRRFAIVVQLHGAGALLGKQRRHLLRLAVLHSGEQALIVLVPLVDL